MKVFTQVIDIALQSPKRFWVAPFSDFKIGVKIVKNGTPVDNEFSVFNGDTELTPDEDLTNGFTTFTLKSNDTGSVEYKVVVDGVGETLKITQIVTDSTVFEMDASGGGVPSDVATQPWVEAYVSAETSAFIDETALSSYATTSDVTAAISTATTDMATQTWVGQQGYLSQNDLSSYATTSAMESYVGTATSNFVTASDVDTAISTATSNFVSATDVSSAISAATSNKVTGGSIGLAPVVSSAVAVYSSVWASLSSTADENTMYVVLPDYVPPTTTKVKYTTTSGLPDWEGDIVGQLKNGSIPNQGQAEVVELGSHVTGIVAGLFSHNTTLKKITIPNSVTGIGDMVFYNCSSIMSVTMLDRTMYNVRSMLGFYWNLKSGCVIRCTDGNITI